MGGGKKGEKIRIMKSDRGNKKKKKGRKVYSEGGKYLEILYYFRVMSTFFVSSSSVLVGGLPLQPHQIPEKNKSYFKKNKVIKFSVIINKIIKGICNTNYCLFTRRI